jgi:hypothetical protein
VLLSPITFVEHHLPIMMLLALLTVSGLGLSAAGAQTSSQRQTCDRRSARHSAHGVVAEPRASKRGAVKLPLNPLMPSSVDREQIAYPTLDNVDSLRGIGNRKAGAGPEVVGEREGVVRELVVQIFDPENPG